MNGKIPASNEVNGQSGFGAEYSDKIDQEPLASTSAIFKKVWTSGCSDSPLGGVTVLYQHVCHLCILLVMIRYLVLNKYWKYLHQWVCFGWSIACFVIVMKLFTDPSTINRALLTSLMNTERMQLYQILDKSIQYCLVNKRPTMILTILLGNRRLIA